MPKSLQEKWKAELYEKFGLTFKIVETAKDLIADLSSKSETVRAIINYEKIRMRKAKDKDDETDKKGKPEIYKSCRLSCREPASV